METGHWILFGGLIAALAGMYFMVRILVYLRSRGERINWFLLRLQWFRYMSRYRELTIEAEGETGPLLRLYTTSMIIALVLVITGAFLLSG